MSTIDIYGDFAEEHCLVMQMLKSCTEENYIFYHHYYFIIQYFFLMVT